MLLELEQAGFRVIGLDISPHMGRMAHKRIERSGSRVSVVLGKAQALPFAEASFSSVLATFPSEFILEPESLEAVWRALLPGGRFVIVVGAQLKGKGVANSVIGWLYAITGQRAGSKAISEQKGIWNLAKERLASAGFDPSIEQVSVNGSCVTLLIGQRED
jgi:ubiquinone/menaquinone biosynthesis C-methylase UbiE